MPYGECGEVRIYYEVHGQGPTLMLISGLSGGTWSWYGQMPAFERDYQTIVFDNRGAGRSSMPPGPYRVEQLAADALCLLDQLQVDKAYVMGLSMGGMIAQELALLASGRIRALLLGCTHFGGSERIPPTPDVLIRFLDNGGLTQEQIIDKNLPFFFSRRFRTTCPDDIEVYRQEQLSAPFQPEHALAAQLDAIRAFDACRRVRNITVPTLVVAGTEDVLVPPENGRLLVDRIPGAELVEISGAGHALHVECRDRLNALAHEFFRRH
jgi:pimeloyl-ACP methyl ester carboxylesterase